MGEYSNLIGPETRIVSTFGLVNRCFVTTDYSLLAMICYQGHYWLWDVCILTYWFHDLELDG